MHDQDSKAIFRLISTRVKRALMSLRAAVAISVIVGIMIASGSTYLQHVGFVENEYKTRAKDELDKLIAFISLALRDPLWTLEPSHIKSILESAMFKQEVLSIKVMDKNGNVLAEKFREATVDNLYIEATRAIERHSIELGVVYIRMSTDGYRQQIQALKQQYMSLSIQASLLALIVILLLLQRRLVAPLSYLIRSSESVAEGNLNNPINPVYKDEIGQLARSMEKTRRSIVQLFSELEAKNTELREANQHLEKRVKDRTESLESAMNSLKQAQSEIVEKEKFASLGRIVAGVAHELNTPIGNALTVSTTLEVDVQELRGQLLSGTLRRSKMSEILERLDHGLSIAVNNLTRSAELITEFKQVAVDQTSDQRRSFDIAKISREILHVLHPALSRSDCKLLCSMEDNIVCDSYPGKFGQVLTNLVMNAVVHAFEDQSVNTLSISIRSIDVDAVELIVSDNGVGMEASMLEKIFDPFFTTKMGRGGTGLGMNIVYSIVTHILGGRIHVASSPGCGTTVTIVLPRFSPRAVNSLQF